MLFTFIFIILVLANQGQCDGFEHIPFASQYYEQRDFDGGYLILEVNETIIFTMGITGPDLYLCNVPRTIEQDGNWYQITTDMIQDTIQIVWDDFSGCGVVETGETVTGTMKNFPASFNIGHPFRLYYTISSHGDYFEVVPGTSSTTSSSSTTTTTSPSITTSTSTTIPDLPCLVEQLYGDHAEETEFLRQIRDDYLSKTTEGQEIIRLYYRWSTILLELIQEDDAIRKDMRNMIDTIIPLLPELHE